VSACLLLGSAATVTHAQWSSIADGMELGRFKTGAATVVGDSTVTILRVDPRLWEFVLLSGRDGLASARRWCELEGLSAATNAGMFATDYRTHVGFMRSDDETNNAAWNGYQSVAVFGAREDGGPRFRIFDLDDEALTTEDFDERYPHVVQNLRLIKREGINRWSPQEKMWSEMALGEDSDGWALLIFCRSPYSMHDFNEILLGLPIGIVAAQHLEGGPEAQLFIDVGETQLEVVGSYETSFNENNSNDRAWPIPNVIGVRRR
jgi:hypothetical protein